MNTDVRIWLQTDHELAGSALAEAEKSFAEATLVLSRFLPESDLCALNAAAGKGARAVSPLLLEVLQLALGLSRETQGIFDPSVLHALCEAGYDATFERVEMEVDAPAPRRIRAQCGGWRDIVVDGDTVRLPPLVSVDLGGIAKGFMVDRVTTDLRKMGPVLVDAGGDIRASGLPGGQPWPVGIGHPLQPGTTIDVVGLRNEALVTSSIGKRRWRRGGRWMHHLIDPRTQEPAVTDLYAVTVLGKTAAISEAHAKVALILGTRDGQEYLASRRLRAWLVQESGDVLVTCADDGGARRRTG